MPGEKDCLDLYYNLFTSKEMMNWLGLFSQIEILRGDQ